MRIPVLFAKRTGIFFAEFRKVRVCEKLKFGIAKRERGTKGKLVFLNGIRIGRV